MRVLKKLVYVFPTATKDKFYYGKQAQFDNYKKAIAAQQGTSKRRCNLQYSQKNQQTYSRPKHMKNLITLTGIASIGVVLALISACETTGTGSGAASQQGQAAAQTGGQPGQQLIQGQFSNQTKQTAGPNQIEVQQFGGFGPMGTAALGDW